MGYIDKYETYLMELPADVEHCERSNRRPVFGYTSDLDVILKWNAEAFNRLLDNYLESEPALHDGDKITNMADFTRIFSYYAIHGIGGEADITSVDVCNVLEASFESNYALGGTCAQGAAALAAVGIPLIAHITDRSKEVCEYLTNSRISFVTPKGLAGAMEAASDELPLRHMILQFNKGDIIRIKDRTYTIPLSNRLIMGFDEVHKIVPIDKLFLQFCEENAGNITSYNISGFNAILELDIAKERMTQLGEHYKRIKAVNPNCKIYLEGAHYLNPEIKKYIFRETADYVDIIGMNEEELVDVARRIGQDVDITSLESILNALTAIKEDFSIAGIITHTKDYSMYYGNDLGTVNIEKGLTMGNLMSGTRARTGRYGSYEDCKESLKLELSPIGLEFAKELSTILTKHHCCLVPSRYMEKPACTIGLGDTFVAGVQISFI